MTSRQRVLAALERRIPDRVPYCEFGIDRPLAARTLGWGDGESAAADLPEDQGPYVASEATSLAEALGLDNITYHLRPPTYARKEAAAGGQEYFVEGLIRTQADLSIVKLTDPTDDSTVRDARSFAAGKGERAACLSTRAGLTPVILGMGMEHFCVCLHENRDLVEELLDRYVDWAISLAQVTRGLGFDVFQTSDDMAFRTGLFFSPDIFRSLLLPRYQKIAEVLDLPWIFHSDGNIEPVLDDLISLGICAIHPVEPLAMDIVALKKRYGDRLCLMGNVDLGLLSEGTTDDVEDEVKRLIQEVGPGGGYIVTSGNSLAHYVQPENVIAMSDTVKNWGRYAPST